jgi:dipeptidyl aminopeptidase/acylaminoacyl peptidase
MSTAAWSISIIAVGYCGLVALLYFAQRWMLYRPKHVQISPVKAGLVEAEEIVLQTKDDEKIIAWHSPPNAGFPVILYFHGNASTIGDAASLFRALIDAGFGILAISYRGFGGSTGRPSESGLIADAHAAYAFAEETTQPNRLWCGENL